MRQTVTKRRVHTQSRTRAVMVAAGVVLALFTATACGVDDQPGGSATESQSPEAADQTTAPAEIKMPSVVDKNAAVAKDELEKLGFTDIQLGSVDPDNNTLGVVNPANWTVKEQSHKKGEEVPADAKIVLGCVKNG